MIGIVATLKIKEGSGSEFEAIASQLVEKVNANEDGVVYINSSHLEHGQFVEGLSLRAEKEM